MKKDLLPIVTKVQYCIIGCSSLKQLQGALAMVLNFNSLYPNAQNEFNNMMEWVSKKRTSLITKLSWGL